MRKEFFDATNLAEAIRSKSISCVEAFDASWNAIELQNPKLAAVCFKSWEVGNSQAKDLDAQIARLNEDERQHLARTRPFLGVPSLMKDLATAAIGLPSQMGSRAVSQGLGAVQWAFDSELVIRYRKAGLNLFGRTTSPEFGISASTEARAYEFLGGPTRNPYSLGHSAGGSSGGAAAAVASRMVLIANASDGAGSIRIPASCCGLYGLKPSRGLMPAGPHIGEAWGGLATEHVLSHSVRDTETMLRATMGIDLGAPYAQPVPIEVNNKNKPLRIALCDTTFDCEAVHAEVANAIRALAARCEALGHIVEVARPAVNTREVIDAVVRLMACGTALVVNRWGYQAHIEALLEPATQGAVALGRATSAPQYLDLLSRLHRITREVAAFHQTYDVMLCPTLAEPPALLGRFAMSNSDYLDYRLGPSGLWKYSPFTPLANATGQPSMSIPAGQSSLGLPIGAMLTGRFGEDFVVLGLAASLEASLEVGLEASAEA
jgi:amidase